MRVGDGALVLTPGQGRPIDVGGFGVMVLATEESTDGVFSVIETSEPDPGVGPPLHIHHDCAESFYVLAGAYEMIVDEARFECGEGSFVYVPRGIRHTFRTFVPRSRKLNLYTPAGMIGYFDELAAGIAAGMDRADLDAIAARHAMEVVGAVPEGYLSDSEMKA